MFMIKKKKLPAYIRALNWLIGSQNDNYSTLVVVCIAWGTELIISRLS